MKGWSLTLQNGGVHDLTEHKEGYIADDEYIYGSCIAVGLADTEEQRRQLYLASRANILLKALQSATALLESILDNMDNSIYQNQTNVELLCHLKKVIHETITLLKEFTK